MIPLGLRRSVRGLRRELSVLKYRLMRILGTDTEAKIVPMAPSGRSIPVAHPAVGIVAPRGVSDERLKALMAGQTETSWTVAADSPEKTPWIWCPGSDIEDLESCHLESLVLAAAALDLDVTLGGWATPEETPARHSSIDQGSLTLMRRPESQPSIGAIRGALVPQITQSTPEIPVAPPTFRSGNFFMNYQGESGAVFRLPLQDINSRLATLAPVSGRPTLLFLAPYLAVGGAEKLLFDLIEGLTPEHRVLVVTLDPHRKELGQTVDQCRRLTPHVYTLGDWIPREARIDCLRHLIRRWQVETLVSWNGTVDFYDNADDLKRDFPKTRIFAQLYNDEGGWIDHTTPKLLTGLHGHLAINDHIRQALIDRGAPVDRVHTVHHGVRVPPPISDEIRDQNRRTRRVELELPEKAVVVGTFIRMHAQKRPMDIVRLARRLESSGLHFLLIGGGPEDAAVDDEILRDPPANLLRLPLQADPLPLYDALDICLMTSEYEGLPVFLLDGLARGIPCVATAVGEIPELLQGGGGILVDSPGDLNALAEGLLDLRDPARRQSEGKIGRQTIVDHFGLDAYVDSYKEIFFPGNTK